MTLKGHWQCHPSLDSLYILSETGKIGYLFSDKIAEMTLEVDQGH